MTKTLPEQTDVLIVGAGPAGATTSLFLAEKGISHIIVDSATFPRDKVDGNAFGSKVIRVLSQLQKSSLKQKILENKEFTNCWGGARIFAPNGKSFKVTFPESNNGSSSFAPIFTIQRLHFDNLLVENLDSQYAQKVFAAAVTDIVRKNGELEVTLTQNDKMSQLRTKLIVGADGEHSVVLQKLGLQQKDSKNHAYTIQAYFRGVKGFDDESHIEAHFLEKLLPGFFFMAPLSHGDVKVGLGTLGTKCEKNQIDLEDLLHHTVQNEPHIAPRFKDATLVGSIDSWRTSFNPRDKQQISGDNYLLTGDAASLCNPFTGFGTGNAMLSGMIAAKHIQRAIQLQKFDKTVLSEYNDEVYRETRKEFEFGHFMQKLMHNPWFVNQFVSNQVVRSLLKTRLGNKGTITSV